MSETLDAVIADWLRPVAVSLSADDIARYRAMTARVKANLTKTTAFHVVGVGYRLTTPSGYQWFCGNLREVDPEFVSAGQDELVTRLACCSIYSALDHDDAPLLALLGGSARFIGGSAAAPELDNAVENALQEASADARRRPTWTALVPRFDAMMKRELRQATDSKPAETEEDRQASLLRLIAQAVDDLASQVAEHASIVDEEYDALWWSYTQRSTTAGTPWRDVSPPARRVVLAAAELSERVGIVPAPPQIVRGLLGLALGDSVATDVTLRDVALAAASESIGVPEAVDRLLPVSSAVAKIAELGSDSTTWSDVLAKSGDLKLDVGAESSALDAAVQIFRELEIGALI